MRAVIVIVLLAILAITLATSPVRKPRGEGVSRRRHLSSSRPRGEKPSKAEKPRSRKPRSRKPKADEKPRSRKPLKEKIAGLEKKLAALKKKLAEKKADKPRSKSPKSKSPKSRKPKSDKPKSRKPRSRKPKSDKPVKKTPKSKSPKSRKPKSDKPAKSRKPRSDKPRSRKPKSEKPAKTMADAEFFDQVSQWWDKKGKNIFTEENVEKAKKAYDIFQQAKQLIKDSKKDNKDAEEAPEAPESDEEAEDVDEDGEDDDTVVSCGQAYDHGTPLGEKKCVMVQGKPVVVETAAAFRKMEAAAKAAGITLQVNSGFRKMAEQEHLYNCHITKKCNNGNLAAKPGFSNHQNGKALDIAVADNKVFTWMRNNASKFGFVRTVPTENWHFELRNTKCNAFVSYTCQ